MHLLIFIYYFIHKFDVQTDRPRRMGAILLFERGSGESEEGVKNSLPNSSWFFPLSE